MSVSGRQENSDIEVELHSPSNDRFILHDSDGFRPNDLTNFNKVNDFIRKRMENAKLEDRIHAIWCADCTDTFAPHSANEKVMSGDSVCRREIARDRR